jgi:hypothetical protein
MYAKLYMSTHGMPMLIAGTSLIFHANAHSWYITDITFNDCMKPVAKLVLCYCSIQELEGR